MTDTIRRLLWATIAGSLFGQAFLVHGAFAWLGAIAYGLAISRFRSARWRSQAIWSTGLVAFVVGLHSWGFLYHGGALFAAQALYQALAGLLVGALLTVRSSRPIITPVRLALVWTAVEFVRQVGTVSYPLVLGGTQVHLLTRSALSVVGASGFSGLIMAWGLAVATALEPVLEGDPDRFRWRRLRRVGNWTSVIAAVCLVGRWQPGLEPVRSPLSVTTVQGSVPRWFYTTINDSAEARAVVEHRYLSMGAAAIENGSDVVIFPETALQRRVTIRDGEVSQRLFETPAEMPPEADSWVVASAYREDVASDGSHEQLLLFNSALLFRVSDPYGVIDAVDKRLLAPLVESHFDAGRGDGLLHLDGVSLGVLICYESMYPRLARELALGAELLVISTNDASFEWAPVSVTHARQGWARAIETGRPLVRAAQSGISLAVDHRGAVLSRLELFEVGLLEADVQPMRGWTWFTLFGYLAGPFALLWSAALACSSTRFWRRVSRRLRTKTRPNNSA